MVVVGLWIGGDEIGLECVVGFYDMCIGDEGCEDFVGGFVVEVGDFEFGEDGIGGVDDDVVVLGG